MKIVSLSLMTVPFFMFATNVFAQTDSKAVPTAQVVSAGDKKAMTEAAGAGMAEVALSQTALSKASNDSVKTFAQHMVDDHTKVNDELKSLASQKNVMLPDALPADAQKNQAKLDKLTGSKFDKEYMKIMVKDHHAAVALFEKMSKKADDADLKAFAAKNLPTLKAHLEMAKSTEKSAS